MSRLCKRCKKPFVAKHRIATTYGIQTITSRYCPECAIATDGDPDAELDCQEYMQHDRVIQRLEDGFTLLGNPPVVFGEDCIE